jgi:hypothetical protein
MARVIMVTHNIVSWGLALLVQGNATLLPLWGEEGGGRGGGMVAGPVWRP